MSCETRFQTLQYSLREISVYLSLVAVLSIVAGGLGCDSSTEPDTPPEDPPLATETIGAGGGTIGVEDFTLTVPSGSFDSDVELSLHESDEDDGFGANRVSRLFQLEGLPATYGDSLEIRIKYNSPLVDNSYIAIGTDKLISGEDNEIAVYELFDATESSGFLTCRMPAEVVANPGLLSASHSRLSARRALFAIITDYGLYSSPHFLVTYPNDPPGLGHYCEQAAGFLEAAHDTVVSVGLGYGQRRFSWPGRVAVMESRSRAKWYPTVLNANREPHIIIKPSAMTESNMPELRSYCGSLMVQLAQFILDDDFAFSGDRWWHIAVGYWFEEKFVDADDFTTPSDFPGNELLPFKGWKVSGPSNEVDHYAGLSPVVKFIVEKHGQRILSGIYGDMYFDQVKAVDAILGRVPGEQNWLPEFFDRYIRGDIYGVQGSIFLGNITTEWTIDGPDDTEMTFHPYGCPHFGANMYQVNLEYSSIGPDATLEFKVESSGVNPDYLTLMVYKVRGNTLELVDSGNPATVTDIENLTRDDYNLLAVVVNSFGEPPYTGTNTLDVTARVDRGLPYKSCNITVGFTASLLEEGQDQPWQSYLAPSWQAVGSFTGDTFTGVIDQDYHGPYTTGTMTVKLDPVSRELISLSVSAETDGGGLVARWGVTCTDVPLYTDPTDSYAEYRVWGTGTCAYISDFHWSSQATGENRTDVVGRTCGQDAAITIQLGI